MPRTDEDGVAVVQSALREWFEDEYPEQPNAVICTALMYELVSRIASNAPSVRAAIALIDQWTLIMKQQVRALGVTRQHP